FASLLFTSSLPTIVNFHGWLLIEEGLRRRIAFSSSITSPAIFSFGLYFFVAYRSWAISKKLIFYCFKSTKLSIFLVVFRPFLSTSSVTQLIFIFKKNH